jgi:hypothetical protein
VSAAHAGPRPDDLLHVDGRRAQRIILSTAREIDHRILVDADMARALTGVRADLGRRHTSRFRRCLEIATTPAASGASERAGFVHLFAGSGTRVLEIVRAADGALCVQAGSGGAEAALVRLDQERFGTLFGEPGPDPRVAAPDHPKGETFELPRPYRAGAVKLDRRTMLQRLYRGLTISNDSADRDLDSETMHVRLPRDYDPGRPAGLLVWASPTPSGRIPSALEPALDAMNLVAIGVDECGNDRDVQDKFQLMFDAVATASRRFHIDRRRVYLAGLSGGGKVSSVLTFCFPEIFAGAVCIVGLGTDATLDAQWGEHRHPYFSRPRRRHLEMARLRPVAVVTGARDFNYAEMKARPDLLLEDGFDRVRFFDIPRLGHAMPGARELHEAIDYVDGAYRAVRAREAGAAQLLLAAYFEDRAGNVAPTEMADREALAEVMKAGPWTDAAWRAVALLQSAPPPPIVAP